MFHTVTVRTLAIAACGWLLAWDASALSVGRASGAALIGRSLEVAVPVTLDSVDPEGPCASADVFYGESRVRRAPSVRWESRGGTDGVLHVVSVDPVDEPMVTLYLRVGCGQSSTRRFVLLAELPPHNEASVPPGRAAVQPPVVDPLPRGQAAAPAAGSAAPPGRTGGLIPGAAADASRGAPARRADASGRRPEASASRGAPAGERPAASLRSETALASPTGRPVRPAPPQLAKKEATGGPRSRLKLEPLDLSIERDPTLRLTTELGTAAAGDPQRRAAAAALWAALRKTPDEAVQDAVRLQGVERELNSLRDVTRQNAAAVGQMRAQVERAQGDGGTATLLIVALSAVLAALLGWLAWRWHRVRQLERVGEWFEQHGEPQHAAADEAPGLVSQPARVSASGPLSAPGAFSTPGPLSGAGPLSAPGPLSRPQPVAGFGAAGLAAGAGAYGASAPDRTPQPTTAPVPMPGWSPSADFQASRGGTVRMVGVEELIDVHDKADFFLSIGEYDQAIAVLEAHVHDQVETSALAWMDLLELYHSLGKRTEYERLRGEFRQRFAGQVPDFDHFDQPSASLESYSRALSRIVALWPSRRVLDVIEESIFRQPGTGGADAFSLEAYRELVLLYHIATEIAPAAQAAPKPPAGRNFPDTALQPLHSLDAPDSSVLDTSAHDHDPLLIPPASSRLGVDIDLSDVGPAASAGAADDGLADATRDGTLWQAAPQQAAPLDDPTQELPALDFLLDDPVPPAGTGGDDGEALDFTLDPLPEAVPAPGTRSEPRLHAPVPELRLEEPDAARARTAASGDGRDGGAPAGSAAGRGPRGSDPAPPGTRELPPLDFDVSAFDPIEGTPRRKREG